MHTDLLVGEGLIPKLGDEPYSHNICEGQMLYNICDDFGWKKRTKVQDETTCFSVKSLFEKTNIFIPQPVDDKVF